MSHRRRPSAPAVACAIAVLLAACVGTANVPAAAPPPLHPEVDAMPATIVTVTTADGEAVVAARVAAAAPDRRRGLMHVPEVPDGAGMLFLFDADHDGGFWMKDTLVPLDIAFLDADGRILEILAMSPCTADPCPVYGPEDPYRAALEVPGGWFAAQGVTAGDMVDWPPPEPDPDDRSP